MGDAKKDVECTSHCLFPCRFKTLIVREEEVTEKPQKWTALPYMLRNLDDFSASMARN